MKRIVMSFALAALVLGLAAACSSVMNGPTPRAAPSYPMGPSGAPGEKPPGVY